MDQYLADRYDCSSAVHAICLQAIAAANRRVRSSLIRGQLGIGEFTDIHTLISQLEVPPHKREFAKHQLAAMKQQEEALKARMEYISSEIESMQDRVTTPRTEEPREQFIQRMRRQRLELEKKRLEGVKHRETALEEEDKREKERQAELRTAALLQQKEEMRKRIAAAQSRRSSVQSWKSDTDKRLKEVSRKPPLCEILELSFDSRRHIEYLRAKEELKQRKKALFSPINKEELDRFASDYTQQQRQRRAAKQEKLKEEQLSLRVANSTQSLFHSKATDAVVEAQRQAKLAASAAAKALKERERNRRLYSQLVQESFHPAVSVRKSEEMEQLRLKAINPRIPTSFSARDLVRFESGERRKQWKLKKLSSSVKLPPLPVKPYYDHSEVQSLPLSPKQFDYLKDQQNKRQQATNMLMKSLPDVRTLSLTAEDPEAVKSVLARLAKAESAAVRQEHLISEVDPVQAKVIDCQDEISQVFVNSIKAKLELINSL